MASFTLALVALSFAQFPVAPEAAPVTPPPTPPPFISIAKRPSREELIDFWTKVMAAKTTTTTPMPTTPAPLSWLEEELADFRRELEAAVEKMKMKRA